MCSALSTSVDNVHACVLQLGCNSLLSPDVCCTHYYSSHAMHAVDDTVSCNLVHITLYLGIL